MRTLLCIHFAISRAFFLALFALFVTAEADIWQGSRQRVLHLTLSFKRKNDDAYEIFGAHKKFCFIYYVTLCLQLIWNA